MKSNEIVVKPTVDTVNGLMDVYSKKGNDISVGVKKYLNGDYSNNGNEVEFYTIGSDWNPEFYIRISSKNGEEITDDVIMSHVEIFYGLCVEEKEIESETNEETKPVEVKSVEDWTAGDILYTSDGYDCTIVSFYKVLKRTPKTLTVIRIKKRYIGEDPSNCHTVPEESLQANEYASEEVARINKYNNAKLDGSRLKFWDGTPLWTDNGFGH